MSVAASYLRSIKKNASETTNTWCWTRSTFSLSCPCPCRVASFTVLYVTPKLSDRPATAPRHYTSCLVVYDAVVTFILMFNRPTDSPTLFVIKSCFIHTELDKNTLHSILFGDIISRRSWRFGVSGFTTNLKFCSSKFRQIWKIYYLWGSITF